MTVLTLATEARGPFHVVVNQSGVTRSAVEPFIQILKKHGDKRARLELFGSWTVRTARRETRDIIVHFASFRLISLIYSGRPTINAWKLGSTSAAK
jgi:hypothetical protein